MADTNSKLNNIDSNTSNSPTFEGTLNALNSAKISGSAYADYINSIYGGGLALQDSGSSLVKNTAIQFDKLKNQSKDLFTANPSATRTETLEMNDAISNSLSTFTNNTISNREMLQNNAQSWFQAVGNLITDESFAKEQGEQYWNSLSGNDKKKYEQMSDLISKTDDNQYFDIFFDDNERKAVNELNKDASDQSSFFSDSWKEAFTPNDYDKRERIENRGFIASTLFGGNWIGNTINFLVWDPLKFMTIDMVSNSATFVYSFFDKEAGIKWLDGLEAGLAIGSWFVMGKGASIGIALESKEAMLAGEKLATMAAEDVVTTLTKDGITTVGDDIIKKASDDLAKSLDELTGFDINPVEGAFQHEEAFSKTVSETLSRPVSKGINDITTRSIIRNDIDKKFGSKAVKSFDKILLEHDSAIKTGLLNKIEKGTVNSLDDLKKYVDVDRLIKTDIITSKEATTISNNVEKIKQRQIYGLDNSVEGHASKHFKDNPSIEKREKDITTHGKANRTETVDSSIYGNIEADEVMDVVSSKAFKNTEQLVDDLLAETGTGKIGRSKLRLKQMRKKDTTKLARKMMDKKTRLKSSNRLGKLADIVAFGQGGRFISAISGSISQSQNQDFDQGSFWNDFFVSNDTFDLTGSVPNLGDNQKVGNSTSPSKIQDQLEQASDPGDMPQEESAQSTENKIKKANKNLFKSFRL